MRSVLLLLLLLLISSGFGRVLLNRVSVCRDAPLERFAFGTAIALGIAALGVFALGMVGQLAFLPITVWWSILALIGAVGIVHNMRDVLHWLGRGRPALRIRDGQAAPNGSSELADGRNGIQDTGTADLTYIRLIAPLTMLVLGLMALFCVCACFQPPAGHEWDVLAYHLADPKVFLLQHQITVLPTEHHSNFPFLMEMLYCVGLLYGGYPEFNGYALANMLHLATGALTIVAVLGFCRRLFPAQVGWIAALLLATTPLYLWECCVAYIDVGLGLYVTLAAFAGVMMIETLRTRPTPRTEAEQRDTAQQGREWGMLAGVALGFALGIKYLALIPFGLLPLLMLYRRIPLRQVLMVVGVAAVIGCPWYVKNLVLTHNPVYPYLYKLFPTSIYWSPDRAAAYQSEQSGFGFSHALTEPGTTLSNLLQTPWRLTTVPNHYTNGGDYTFLAIVGGLYAAGICPLVFLRRIPRPIIDLLILLGVQLLAWFFTAQVIRYLVSFLPLAAVITAYGFSTISGLDRSRDRHSAKNVRFFPVLVTLIMTGQAAFMVWALAVLPTSSTIAARSGMALTALSLETVLKNATDPDSAHEYLSHLDGFNAMEWINHNTPKTAGVVLYDETRGFYLDRPYLWGNMEHSSYIPYEHMKDGTDLTVWLTQHGYRYVLINLKWSPKNPRTGMINGQELEALRAWYMETPVPGEWRFLLADAMRRGLWTVTSEHENSVVVLEIDADRVHSESTPRAGRNLP